jgi:hypothetical protein
MISAVSSIVAPIQATPALPIRSSASDPIRLPPLMPASTEHIAGNRGDTENQQPTAECRPVHPGGGTEHGADEGQHGECPGDPRHGQ